MKLILSLMVLAGLGVAFAQDAVVGIPQEYSVMVFGMIAVVSGLLVEPLTALAKRAGNTQGVTTGTVSAVLSLVVAFGFTLAQSLNTDTPVNVWAALGVAFWAFVQANGSYISKMLAAKRGTEKAGQDVSGDNVLPLDKGTPLDAPASGLETLPLTSWGEAVPFMGAPLVEMGLGALVEQLLRQSRLPASVDDVARVVARLALGAPDLLDGSAYLSSDNRGRIPGVLLGLKRGGGL